LEETESLREVLGVFELRNKAKKGNVPSVGKNDVQNCGKSFVEGRVGSVVNRAHAWLGDGDTHHCDYHGSSNANKGSD
jgi:hypothetical protein